jgi:Holliday junction DNA helicase RuvA
MLKIRLRLLCRLAFSAPLVIGINKLFYVGALYGIVSKKARLPTFSGVRYNTHMISIIEGTVHTVTDSSVTVLVHGVGFLVHIPHERYSIVTGDHITLYTYLAVRETSLDLYGFLEERERECFELLLLVPKIGPKSALQILSQSDPDIIATAVLLGDAEHLHKTSGIGKKTALNIVTALTGKIDAAAAKVDTPSSVPTPLFTHNQRDAIDALITLGYEQKEAESRVLKLAPDLEAKALIQSVLTGKDL